MVKNVLAAIGFWVVSRHAYAHYRDYQALKARAERRDHTHEEA